MVADAFSFDVALALSPQVRKTMLVVAGCGGVVCFRGF